MTINFTNSSPLHKAFKANEEQILKVIRLAATNSAISMGPDFNNVYYRCCQNLQQLKQEAA